MEEGTGSSEDVEHEPEEFQDSVGFGESVVLEQLFAESDFDFFEHL